ncbi:DNA-binding protein [Pseudomonas sp. FSL R10-0056]|uniref:DNA-binding protein n=1 Tax=unclassified Pseudomonas TaxID=196821 RepID=UPI0012956AED|nr:MULTISPECIES: DNA-binding protein [unclassified Pseudomonas]MQT63881.1 DNA-binding protein [Pseudomonas sp. FSL R10-0056]MQT69805.1 DNA-binding protein [Pseudomonas sp. FSL R10-0071]MQU48634.1 DNA-binding protein [Pseudomonas sp. FSL A6-1183]
MSTEQYLVEKYGPLMTLSQVAELFGRSPDGLRFTIRQDSDLGRRLSAEKKKLGRRVYFLAVGVARLIDES